VQQDGAIISASALSVNGVVSDPVTSARDLGIYIDNDLSTRTLVQRTVSHCFVVLWLIVKLVPESDSHGPNTRVRGSVATALGQWPAYWLGLSVFLRRRLQSVHNTFRNVSTLVRFVLL